MVERDEWLQPVAEKIEERHNRYLKRMVAIEQQSGSITGVARRNKEKGAARRLGTVESGSVEGNGGHRRLDCVGKRKGERAGKLTKTEKGENGGKRRGEQSADARTARGNLR